MNPDQIVTLLNARPFQRFTIHVSNRADYYIPSPEFVLRTKSGRSMSILSDDGETFAIVDNLHVTRITTEKEVELAVEEPRRKPA